jgi:hypothetical protein
MLVRLDYMTLATKDVDLPKLLRNEAATAAHSIAIGTSLIVTQAYVYRQSLTLGKKFRNPYS